MYKQILTIIISCSILLSCSNKKTEVPSDDYIQTEEKNIEIDEYSNNALEILNRHKEKNLQIVLPNIIYDQVKIYDNLLIEYEKKQTYANSDLEFLEYKEEIENLTLESLLMKDIEINLAYNELLSEIEELNISYSKKYKINNLESVFDLDNIILSEEVLLKIKEFSKDEKQRIKIQNQNDFQSIGVDGIVLAAGFFPGGSLITKSALRGISQGTKLAKQGKGIANNASLIAKKTHALMSTAGSTTMGATVRNKVTKTLSNDIKRQVLAERQLINIKRGSTAIALKKSTELTNISPAKIKRSKDFFKVIENKLEGRVGDYSDGILSVHLQNIREVIKRNQTVLSKSKK